LPSHFVAPSGVFDAAVEFALESETSGFSEVQVPLILFLNLKRQIVFQTSGVVVADAVDFALEFVSPALRRASLT
jgi:hypothetical protein